MATQEWKDTTAASILASAAVSNLNKAESTKMEGLAFLQSKRKKLMSMDPELARKQFDKMDPSIQEALSKTFGPEQYNTKFDQNQSFFDTVKGFAADTAQSVLNAAGAWTEAISTPYRVVRSMQQGTASLGGLFSDGLDFWNSQDWKTAADGETLFDKGKLELLNKTYSSEVRFIAKRVSMGMSSADILASITTEKQLQAYSDWLGDKNQTLKNAIRDYNDAHFSWGRDLAGVIGLHNEIGVTNQSVQNNFYNWISGGADLVGDVAFDPLTYIAAPIKAVQVARYGTMELAKAGVGELSFTQKMLARTGAAVGPDAIFEIPRVKQAWDEAGALVRKLHGKNIQQRAPIIQQIKLILPGFDDNVVKQLRANKVFSADDAKRWFKENDSVHSIFRGESGSKQLMIPHRTVTGTIRSAFAKVVPAVGRKTVYTAPAYSDDLITMLQKGKSIDALNASKKITAFTKRHANMITRAMNATSRGRERALIDNVIFIGGKGKAGEDLAAKSYGTIYTLSRSFLSKETSHLIATAFVHSRDSGARMNIVKGIYRSMADASGVAWRGQDKRAFDAFMKNLEAGVYAEPTVVDDAIRKSKILGNRPPKEYNPGIVNGKPHAAGVAQISNQIALPNLTEFAKLIHSKTAVRAISNTINNRAVSQITDYWSALNLLPRLGMRSVIDENVFHFLTIPLTALPNVIKGYHSSVLNRIITHDPEFTRLFTTKTWYDKAGNKINPENLPWYKPGRVPNPFRQKDIGIIARIMRRGVVNVKDDVIRKAQGDAMVEAQLTEQIVTHSFFGKLLYGKDDVRYLTDHVLHGYSRTTEEMSRGVTEAQTLAKSGQSEAYGNYSTTFGVNVKAAMKDLHVDFGKQMAILSSGTPEFKVNFMIQLVHRLEGPLGKIAVLNIKNPAKAVREMEKFLKTTRQGRIIYTQMSRSAFQTQNQVATDMFLWMRNALIDDKGNVNNKLIKMLKGTRDDGSIYIRAHELTLDDIESLGNSLPQKLLGRVAVVESHKNLAELFSAILDRGFQVVDRQVGTLSREPVMYAYVLRYRRALQPLQDAFEKRLIANGTDAETAAKISSERFAHIGNDMAFNRMIGYVDNPAVRSNLAFNGRNLARYYRATEDFWRRASRIAKYDPEALVRLRIAKEGLDHAGFIHEDENGDMYFTIPMDSIMYNLYAPVVTMLTGHEPRNPMPLTLSGKIRMLAPSFDPDSALPTFSSPLMSLGWNTVVAPLLPPEYRGALTTATMGKYAENQDLGQALTPSVLRNVSELFTASLGHQSEQVASATLKAAAFYQSIDPLDQNSTLGEIEQRKFDIQASARNIIALRSLLGIFLPVNPTTMQNQDVTQNMRDIGVVSFKDQWNKLLQAEFKKNESDPYGTAMKKFTKAFPGKLIYTVSESDTNSVATIPKTKAAADWMKRNSDVVSKHPEGSLFLVPQYGQFDMASYAYLKREGYITQYSLDDYFDKILNLDVENQYQDIKKKYNDLILNAANPEYASIYRSRMENELAAFKKDKPYLKIKFENFNAETNLKEQVLNDTRDLIDSGNIPSDSKYSAQIIRRMITEYDNAVNVISSYTAQSSDAIILRKQAKADALDSIAQLTQGNPNAVAFYDNIIKKLLG